MIISRKVAVSALMSALALAAVWAVKKYLGYDLDPEQAMGVLIFVATSAGWLTKEDARVAQYLDLRGKHRPTVAELVAEQDGDRQGGLYQTDELPAIRK